MAQKKFSRLSILLEARDKMSNVFRRNAEASERLSNRINRLDREMNGNRQSMIRTIAQQRLLGESTARLSSWIDRSTNKTNIMRKAFLLLPKPIRMTVYYIEGTVRALGNLIFRNKLAVLSAKTLRNTFKYAGLSLLVFARAVQLAVYNLGKFSGINKVLKLMFNPIKKLSIATWQFFKNTKLAIGAAMLYRNTIGGIKGVYQNIKLATLAQKLYIKNGVQILKQSTYWNKLSNSVKSVKRSIAEVNLAFTLWKNSSTAVQKTKAAVDKLLSPFRSLKNLIQQNVNQYNRFANQMNQTGTRGRATFNQLADANARLNRQIAKMNSELAKANSRLGSMRTNLGSINAVGAAFSAAYLGQAAAQGGEKVVTETVGYSMEQQYNKASVGILAGAKNAEPFYNKIQSYAATTAYATEEWSKNMRGAIGKSKTVEDLEKYMVVMEQLATLDPIQGLDGAALAVRELNSGDIVSLVERFELPRSALKQIKNIADPIEQIQELSALVGRETGYTVENIQKMKELPLMQWQKAQNIWKTMKGYMGEASLKLLSPLIEGFNKMWDDGKLDGFVESMNQKLGNVTKGIINFVKNFGSNIDKFKEKNSGLIGLWDNIQASYEEAKPKLSAIFSNVVDIVNKAAGTLNTFWPQINWLIQGVLTLVQKLTSFISNNFNTIISVIAGVAAAWGTWKIVSTVTSLINMFQKGVLLAKAATLLFNSAIWKVTAAMLANPIGLVITLVVGLGVALYVAYQKSETFREAVQAAWTWIKDVGAGAVEIGKAAIEGLSDAFKSAWEWVGSLWDRFMGFVDDIKNTKINWSGILPGGESFIQWGGAEKADGKHHGGISNIPHDGYKAILHKGERVLTRGENKEYSNGGGEQVVISGNNITVREDADIDKIAESFLQKLINHRQLRGV